MRLTHFGGQSLPTPAEDLDTPIEARSALVELPDGGFDQDGQKTVLRPVTITRSFKITSSLDSTMDAILGKMYKGRMVLKAILRDNSTYRQTFAKILKVERPRNPADVNVQRVVITFLQNFPFWFKSTHEPHYLDHGDVLDDGWFLDGNYTTFTINASSITGTITTAGNVPVKRGTLVIRPASSASLTNLTITNKTNWQIFRYEDTLAYPSVLVVDLLAKSAKVDGVNAYADVGIPTGQMDWMQLEVGANSIQMDVESRSGNTTVEWHWSDTYL